MNKKERLTKYVETLTKAEKRKDAILKEIENDKSTLAHIDTLSTLPSDSNYESLEKWKEAMNKQIARGEKSIETIEFKKVLIEAINYYLENNE